MGGEKLQTGWVKDSDYEKPTPTRGPTPVTP